jgi:hypothetical protein
MVQAMREVGDEAGWMAQRVVHAATRYESKWAYQRHEAHQYQRYERRMMPDIASGCS